jgi:hypothetical protein
MSEYSKGGIVGGSVRVTMVPQSRPPGGGGDWHVVYADECIISGDMVCRRDDAWHKAADVPPNVWICLAHPAA